MSSVNNCCLPRVSFCSKLSDCFSSIYDRISNCFQRSVVERKAYISLEEESNSTPLLGPIENKSNFPLPISLAVLGCSCGIIAGSILINPKIDEYVHTCLDYLNDLQSDLHTCQKPFLPSIHGYEALIGASCGLLGFICQDWSDRKSVLVGTGFLSSIARLIKRIQSTFSFEANLITGYWYNGFWINTEDASSWRSYFKLQASAIAIASTFLGMYINVQYRGIKELLQKISDTQPPVEPLIWSKRKGTLAVSILGAGAAFSSFAISSRFWSYIVLEVGFMLSMRPLGIVFSHKIKRLTNSENSRVKKTGKIASGILKRSPPITVVLCYLTYLSEGRKLPNRLGAMLLFSLASAIKEDHYVSEDIDIEEKDSNPIPSSLCGRFKFLLTSYKATIFSITFILVSSEIPFLRCYDVENFNCPISFELSGDYVNIDHSGLNVVVISALATYHFRSLLRFFKASPKSSPFVQRVATSVLDRLNLYQLEFLSSLPYVMAHSGTYIPDYGDYASYNPNFLMSLLGFVYGNYRETVNIKKEDPFKPLTANTAILKDLI